MNWGLFSTRLFCSVFGAACLAATLVIAPSTPATATLGVKADRIVVLKSERRLILQREGRELKAYPIALGGTPTGHKRQQGDGRTPEGEYVVDWRNPESKFFLSLHISYPNAADSARASAAGLDPGGNIMIHGLPAHYRGPEPDRFHVDWTEGCIGVGNSAMQEIWTMVENGTTVEIRP